MSITVVNAGTQLFIESNGTDPNLTAVTSLKVTYTDLNNFDHEYVVPDAAFLTQTATLIAFDIPDGCNFTADILVLIDLLGTQFSGSVTLGPNRVIIVNGSGIYKLTTGKSSDTIYVDSSVGSGTTDVAIPNPFAETGFIGG